MKKILYLSISCLLFTALSAQKMQVRKGEKEYHNLNFDKSYAHFEKDYEKNETTTSIVKNAESFYNLKNYERALKWYDRAHDKQLIETVEQVQEYLHAQQMAGLAPATINQTKAFYKNTLEAGGLRLSTALREVEFYNDIKAVCSNSNLDDYAPFMHAEQLYFFSSRTPNKVGDAYNYNKQAYGRMYQAEDCEASLLHKSSATNVPNVKKLVSSDVHIGPMVWDTEGQLAFANMNHREATADGTFHLKLMVGRKHENKWKWEDFPLNNKEYTVQHPWYDAVSKRLYFASNMPGGKGGHDIYFVEVRENGFSQPQSLVAINTASDEIAPYLDEQGTLFFSSRGYLEHGGFDILSYSRETGIASLPAPINSAHNDLFYIKHNNTVYFSSDRNGFGNGDIFTTDFTIPRNLKLQVELVDRIDNPTIQLQTIGSGDMYTITPDDLSPVKERKAYRLVVEAPGYESYEETFEAHAAVNTDIILKKVRLEKRLPESIKLEVETFLDNELVSASHEVRNANTQERVTPVNGRYPLLKGAAFLITSNIEGHDAQERVVEVSASITVDLKETFHFNTIKAREPEAPVAYKTLEVEDIYFHFDKSYIKASAQEKLNHLMGVLRTHPEATIRLTGHTDARGSHAYNQALSKRRIDAAVAYLVKHGIPTEKIERTSWFGEEQLSNNCADAMPCDEVKHALNRRVEVELVLYQLVK